MAILTQTPAPGEHRLFFRGDAVNFTLKLDEPLKGKAFLRTNIGNAAVRRKEIIEQVESEMDRNAQDWHDLPMVKIDDCTYKITMALTQVAHFEAKCCFFPDNSLEPLWGDGDNTHINVEPSDYCSSNTIYCAFVRQFGLNKEKAHAAHKPLTKVKDSDIEVLDDAGYAVIPPSGTFRDLIKEVDFIVDDLKCRILHLLPINPTPTVYGRMGRHGSPYASLDFTAIDPSLCEFDRSATPLDQFMELVGAVHRKNAKVFLDIAINHTGWAAKLHETNPEWLVREDDNAIHSPGAWGTVWGDLTELDHQKLELWQYLADMFLVWCERGVDGFRCDAGYMIPVPAWEYIIARVRSQYPEAVFLLEGLGGDPAITIELLDRANMNWAYSELFQNYSRQEVEGYLKYSDHVSASDGLMVHYAETHDNMRLAGESHSYAKLRTALCALTSSNGAFGFANGVEWFAKEKIDVHMAQGLNWGAKDNQVKFIGRLNTILCGHPAFHNNARINFIDSGNQNGVALVRQDEEHQSPLLVVLNLDSNNPNKIKINQSDVPFEITNSIDLIEGKAVKASQGQHDHIYNIMLKPGEVLCLAADKADYQLIKDVESEKISPRANINQQKAQAMALEVMCWKNKSNVIGNFDHKELAAMLHKSPEAFLEHVFGDDHAVPVVEWQWPQDMTRKVMVPPNHIIMVTAPYRFHASLSDDKKIITPAECLKDKNGRYFSLIIPKRSTASHANRTLNMKVCCEDEFKIGKAELLYLAKDMTHSKMVLNNKELRETTHTFLDGNGRGGILRPSLKWGELRSRYDCLIGANLSTEFPEDRHIMLRRMRGWVVYHGRWKQFSIKVTKDVKINQNGGVSWDFKLPIGNGLFANITVAMEMVDGKNAIRVNVVRHESAGRKNYLKDDHPLRVVLRPDIEDRNFHMDTKASHGPEEYWPGLVQAAGKSVTFKAADDRELYMASNKGHFCESHEWHYNIFCEKEASRGLEAHGDLFSPGYFEIDLVGGENARVIGQVITSWENEKVDIAEACDIAPLMEPADNSVDKVLLRAMEKYVVKRGDLKTVIAGYPWFKDWGRDTLICVRGLIAAGMVDDVKAILLQFAKFAENGTLPNIIHGDDVGNRDTSDAPLWFFTACEDLCKLEGNHKFLDTVVDGGGKLIEVMESIAQGYIDGTPNHIKVDHSSHLIYSPSHFTWMDTNYPAGTPREGYPIEIQAFWFAAVNFLGKVTGKTDWQHLANKVKASIKKYFVLDKEGYLSDCLHCSAGTPASKAVADDHLRPNQLFALTLGAVDDEQLAKSILRKTQALLVPGGIRSLADKPVKHELQVHSSDGHLLNDPANPYWGHYEGDEDSRRKPAYHNGTVWSWPFPSYCEAYYMVYGEFGVKTAKSILASSEILLNEGCLGQIPEIMDGNAPHKERGCDAQAWGVTELYRVWKLLHN